MKTIGQLCDWQIRELCEGDHSMISPFVPHQVREENGERIVSYGLSSAGYDIRCQPVWSRSIDAAAIPCFEDRQETFRMPTYVLRPGEMMLTTSVETFGMPDGVMGVCVGKSTWARLGLFVNVTPLEPGWRGELTIELSNISHRAIVVQAGVGIAQILFIALAGVPEVTYADRNGKYQNQTGVTGAKL